MRLSSMMRAHADAVTGISIEDTALIVQRSKRGRDESRYDDPGIDPHGQFRERLALPNADLPARGRTYDRD